MRRQRRVGKVGVRGGLDDKHPGVVEVEALSAVRVLPRDGSEEAVHYGIAVRRRRVPREDGRDVAVGGHACVCIYRGFRYAGRAHKSEGGAGLAGK